MCTLQWVAPEFIPKIWPDVKEHIKNGLSSSADELTEEHIKVYLIEQMQNLLVIMDETNSIIGAIVIQLSTSPNERIAFITSIGGARTKDIWVQLVDWCKHNGATVIRGCANEAVARLWRKQFQFESRYFVVEKRLWAES
jgi:hypothetical protein